MKSYGLKRTVKRVYDEMPEEFHATALISRVRVQLIRDGKEKRPFDSTILRKLRWLRTNEKSINWVCINNETSLYKKPNKTIL